MVHLSSKVCQNSTLTHSWVNASTCTFVWGYNGLWMRVWERGLNGCIFFSQRNTDPLSCPNVCWHFEANCLQLSALCVYVYLYCSCCGDIILFREVVLVQNQSEDRNRQAALTAKVRLISQKTLSQYNIFWIDVNINLSVCLLEFTFPISSLLSLPRPIIQTGESLHTLLCLIGTLRHKGGLMTAACKYVSYYNCIGKPADFWLISIIFHVAVERLEPPVPRSGGEE